MLPCECGGKLYRHQHGFLKRTGEEYQSFLCRDCGRTIKFYRKDDLHWTPERRGVGKAHCDDTEFMDALRRSRDENGAVGSIKSNSHG